MHIIYLRYAWDPTFIKHEAIESDIVRIHVNEIKFILLTHGVKSLHDVNDTL